MSIAAEAHPAAGPAPAARKAWMEALAKAPPAVLAEGLAALGGEPAFDWLRRPERGAVMVRGRAGGTGAPFNLGEMTVTRCSLRLATGEVGHAWIAGRDADRARRAALADALMQGPRAAEVERLVVAPARAALAEARRARAGRAAATKVDFFTMVRGESA